MTQINKTAEKPSSIGKAFFINGGAGRVLCSIPAFEKYAEKHDNFVIIAEGGMDFFKGHPLHKKVFEPWHKGLYEEYLKDKELIQTEPYHLYEYHTQKCNLIQAFDKIINSRDTIRPMKDLNISPIHFNKSELFSAYEVIKEIKEVKGRDKVIVIQPFGRGATQTEDFIYDFSGRSIELANLNSIVKELTKEYAVIIMSELSIPGAGNLGVAIPEGATLRIWAAIIAQCDYFIGCDSVGQHMANAVNKPATVIVGATYPENISYPENKEFNIIDLGKGSRMYSPIRVSQDEVVDLNNENLMQMTDTQIRDIIKNIKQKVGKGKKTKPNPDAASNIQSHQSCACGENH